MDIFASLEHSSAVLPGRLDGLGHDVVSRCFSSGLVLRSSEAAMFNVWLAYVVDSSLGDYKTQLCHMSAIQNAG